MSDVNHVILIGRLTRDAELKYTSSGQPVSKFSIAVSRNVKRGEKWEDEANFFDIVLWGKRTEVLDQYLTKGKQIGVDGELRQERWQDRNSGQSRSRVEIVASNIQLLGGGNGESRGSAGTSGGNSSNSGRPSCPPRDEPPPSDDGFMDDIPF
jgi:single-strand DNA-binding protein